MNGNIRINIKRAMCIYLLFYPIMYFFVAMIQQSLTLSLIKITLILLLVIIVHSPTKNNIYFLLFIGILVIINLMLHGVGYVLNADFYTFVLFLCIMYVFVEKKMNIIMYEIMKQPKTIKAWLYIYMGLLVINIVWGNGLQITRDWGHETYILKGPFDLPHTMSYLQILVYCIASINLNVNKDKSNYIFMILALICSMLTGVRSGAVVLVFIVLCDYLSIHKISLKIVGGVLVGGILLYLAVFTDLLSNSAIVQKTLNAISRGTISNGREMYSSYLISEYVGNVSIIDKFWGIGLKGIRELMLSEVGVNIHAHNDFINVLMGFGIVAFIYFITLMIRFTRLTKMWYLAFGCIIILAYTNGIYMYAGFTVSIAILINFFYTKYDCNEKNI